MLEADLGLTLLDRSGRAVKATAAGERVFDICIASIDAAAATEVELGLEWGGDVTGRVSLFGPNSLLETVFLPLIDGLRRKFPAIELELHADDAKSDLSTDDFDLSIRTGDQRRGRDVAVALPVAPRAPFASPKLLRRFASPMTPSDLANLPAVMRMQEPPVWSFHTSDSVRKDACPKPAFQVNTMELALASAKLGEGVAILPELLVERDVKNGTLVRLLPDWSLDPVKVSLPCRAQRLSIPAVAVVRRLIVEECKSRSGPLVGKL